MKLNQIKSELLLMVPAFAKKVAPVYQLLEWQWSSGKSQPYVPSVGEIENVLYSLIESLSAKYFASGSGGLEAYYQLPTKDESGEYGLSFTISEKGFFD